MKIINIKNKVYFDIYGGRPGPLGNPFIIGKDGTRDEVCDKYEEWFKKEINTNSQFLKAVLGCKGKVVGCYCAPERCHLQTIQRWLNDS